MQEIFDLKCLIKNIDIKLCAHCETGIRQLLAVITSENEIVLYYCFGELPAVIKRIPWFTDTHKQIQAICFDASATWLLLVSIDGSLYIIPALNLADKRQKIDCKWSINDITHFPNPSLNQNNTSVKPTSCVWWPTLDCNQNALVGYENGAIILISLTDGRCLGTCGIPEPVKQLYLCQDNTLETVSLLINSTEDHQWRLILEHHATGYVWPPDNHPENGVKSTFYSLKQLGVDKFSSFKQRFTEGRRNRLDSQTSDTTSESSHSESNISNQSGPEMLPHLCDTYFAPQYARNRYLISALYRPTSLLTVHVADIETAPLYVYKLLPKTSVILLTDKIIYCIGEKNIVSVISCQLAESRLEGECEFNEESLVAQFFINESIKDIFKVADMSAVATYPKQQENKEGNLFKLPKTAQDINYLKPRIDTCLVVTDKSVYKLLLRYSPVQKFVEYVTEENDLEKAEKLSIVFGLNLQQLLECCGDLMISRGAFHSGIILYKQAKVHLLKRVLKLAITADCKTLLKFVHLCLSASKVDMSVTTKIHIGNVAVMAYTELSLRSKGHTKASNTKDFMKFLCYESHYDQILAVNIACQAGQWNIVNLLSKSKGLQPETVTAFGKILQGDKSPKYTDLEFLYALSEPTLIQSLLVLPQCSQVIFQYIKKHIYHFPLEILKRFALQLDPSQPCAMPYVSAMFKGYTSNIVYNMEYQSDSSDFEHSDSCLIIIQDLVETFLFVLISIVEKCDKSSFDLSLLEKVPEREREDENLIKKMPDLRLLSCGHEHAAVIRNSDVYTMGVSNSGCLGIGPLLTHTSAPRLVSTLHDLQIVALSVSCGRKHTLCATDCGLFAWGSNYYGQLGLGPYVHESPYPQIVTTLASVKIIDIAAGQYHSIGLTSEGKVYTWGWGIHGQLGHANCDTQFYPRLLEFEEAVRQVTAGHAHSIILTCDGKLYGFGSNVFGQLENCHVKSKKYTTPTWIVLMPDMYSPVEKVATAYFHNIAVTTDQKVYSWGASPEEMRISQSRLNQKQPGGGVIRLSNNSWKSCVNVYTGTNEKPIKQVAIGYRHSAILHNGNIWWGRTKETELTNPHARDPYLNEVFYQKFWHVACGLDYTMGIDHTGQVLAWGSPSMIQTILGSTPDLDRRKPDSKVMVLRNTKRVVRFPHNGQNDIPVEISVLPSMAFTYNQTNHKVLLSKKFVPYSVMMVEDQDLPKDKNDEVQQRKQDYNHIYDVPELNLGQKTLHYTLEYFLGFYDTEKVTQKCLKSNNYQAASKISFLDGHFGDSLGFLLLAFKKHIENLNLDLTSLFTCKDFYDLKEKEQGVELIIQSIREIPGFSNGSSPVHLLSSSSSLNSLRQFEDEGGCESPCEITDIKQNVASYVQSLKNVDSQPILSVSETILENITRTDLNFKGKPSFNLQIKDKTAKDIIKSASTIVEFYIEKIYTSENHILMQNILLKCIEFWLSNNLPVPILEDILLKNLDKYFYPLSILLFCKNFESMEDLRKDNEDLQPQNSSGFLKEFSTKFCLHLCSMVLENANKI